MRVDATATSGPGLHTKSLTLAGISDTSKKSGDQA